MGAMSIMMMSSTSMPSTSGVTLISDLTPPLAPPRSIPIAKLSYCKWPGTMARGSVHRSADGQTTQLRRLLDEVVDELRRRVVHLDVEVLDTAGEVVVEPHRRDRHDETERGFDERLGDTGRDR